jgi:hypothetical protein
VSWLNRLLWINGVKTAGKRKPAPSRQIREARSKTRKNNICNINQTGEARSNIRPQQQGSRRDHRLGAVTHAQGAENRGQVDCIAVKWLGGALLT